MVNGNERFAPSHSPGSTEREQTEEKQNKEANPLSSLSDSLASASALPSVSPFSSPSQNTDLHERNHVNSDKHQQFLARFARDAHSHQSREEQSHPLHSSPSSSAIRMTHTDTVMMTENDDFLHVTEVNQPKFSPRCSSPLAARSDQLMDGMSAAAAQQQHCCKSIGLL